MEEIVTPEGYAGLTAPVQIKIEEDGQVFIDEERQPNLLVSGEKNNQIELIVTNQVKVSLPGNRRELAWVAGDSFSKSASPFSWKLFVR